MDSQLAHIISYNLRLFYLLYINIKRERWDLSRLFLKRQTKNIYIHTITLGRSGDGSVALPYCTAALATALLSLSSFFTFSLAHHPMVGCKEWSVNDASSLRLSMLNASTDCSSLARLSPSRVFIHKRWTLHVKAAHHCHAPSLSLSWTRAQSWFSKY